MKKIVHIIQSLEKGGAQMLLCDLAVRCAFQYEVIVISQYNQIDEKLEEILKSANVRIIVCHKKPGFDVKAVCELWRILNNIKPDVVHTHLQSAFYTIPWYLFHQNHKRVHTIHSMPKMEVPKAHRIALGFAYHFLHVIPVAISDTVFSEIKKMYHLKIEKIALIYNGVDVRKFSLGRKEKDGFFDIINVASFFPWKNQSLLVHALKKIHEENQNFRVTFVGDGPEKNNVIALCKSLELEQAVTFYGLTDNVAECLKKSDVFVLCSTFEGLPLSILEAYASGLPVVSTDVGGVPDILTNGKNGFLVESNHTDQLAQALTKLYREKELYTQISGYNLSDVKKYDIQKTAEEYMVLYE
jgi:Glycosyltransferase